MVSFSILPTSDVPDQRIKAVCLAISPTSAPLPQELIVSLVSQLTVPGNEGLVFVFGVEGWLLVG